jgi:hypothetical protein
MVRPLGYRRDPPKPGWAKPDHDAAPTLGAAPPPPEAHNQSLVVEILDQGAASSCVAHAIPQAIRMAHVRAGIPAPQLMSRLFGYYASRAEHGEQDVDDGTYLRTFFQALNQFGFCPEGYWPYDLENVNTEPPGSAFWAGFDQRSPTVYQRISSAGPARIDDIKRAIAAGFGVCFGTDVSEQFCAGELGQGPIAPPVGLPIAGGHALVLDGYEGDAFSVVNSWGVPGGATAGGAPSAPTTWPGPTPPTCGSSPRRRSTRCEPLAAQRRR